MNGKSGEKEAGSKEKQKLSVTSVILIVLLLGILILVLIPIVQRFWWIIKIALILIIAVVLLAFLIISFSTFLKRTRPVYKRITWALLIISALLLIFLVVYSIINEEILYSSTAYSYSPRNVEKYKKELADPDLYPHLNVSATAFGMESGYYHHAWSDDELIELEIPNKGFERSVFMSDSPVDWSVWGGGVYTDKNCFEGEKCLYVDVDDSPYGYLMLTSRPVDVHEFYNYTFSFNVYCVECNNKSAYMSIIWLTNMSFIGEPHKITERGRSVLYLNNTQGYEPFRIDAQAPNSAIKAVVAFRIHIEGASVQPRTRLYIDG